MTPNAHDACVFNKVGEKDDQITVAFHVDDLLITSGDKWFNQTPQDEFRGNIREHDRCSFVFVYDHI
jgi:hypothetical protein